jgi:AAA domain
MKGNGAENPRRLLTLEEFVTQPTVSYQIRGIDPGRAIVVVFGPPKGGKTFSVCDLTMHAAHGMSWCGHTIRKRLSVAYLAGEGVNGLKVRLRAWQEYHDGVSEAGAFRIFPHALSLPTEAAGLVEILRPFKPNIVVADTLNSYFGGADENSTQDMTVFCGAVRHLRDELECSVYVIHHTGHGDSGRERGSIVLRATADVLIQVAKDENAGELVGFQVIAARDIERMENAAALRLVRHETEWLDTDGEPFVSCIVQAADQPVRLPGRGGRPLGEAQANLLSIIHEMAQGKEPNAPNGEIVLARHAVSVMAHERGLDRRRVSQSLKSLASRHLVRLIEPGSVAIRRNGV